MFTISALSFCVGLFVALLVCMEIGWRVGRHRRGDAPTTDDGTKSLEAALFGLLGLMVAFTFYGAASRFDTRRLLIVEEANDIGTTYLRLRFLPDSSRPLLEEKLREYLNLRVATYASWDDQKKRAELTDRVGNQQKLLWDGVIAALGPNLHTPTSALLLNSLNQTFDIANTRMKAAQIHPPKIIYILLVLAALICAVFSGIGMARTNGRNWIHIIGFAFILSSVFYVIEDMEYPRKGFIRIDSFDQTLEELQKTIP